MQDIINDPVEIKQWLKGRPINNLRVSSNAFTRKLIFADYTTSEYIICNLSAFRLDHKLYKLFLRIQNKNHINAMFDDWLRIMTL